MTGPASSWLDEAPTCEPIQFLSQDGHLLDGRETSLTGAQVRTALRWMLLSRRLDEKLTALQRQGRVGLYGPVLGQEAAVIGSHLAVDPATDWLVPASREQPAMLRHGWPLERMLASYLGRSGAARIPDEVRMLPRQQSIATQLPHAVGIAWALKIRAQPGLVLAYCGDGATSEGDFHEACNLAGVMEAPVVFVILNNQYAISTHVSHQTRAARLADRAHGYGFPGVTVDGNDCVAMYEVTTAGVAHVRAGHGPVMIEALTYRVGFHNTSDNPALYREPDEVAQATAHDPLARLLAYATHVGLADQDFFDAQTAEVRAQVDAALACALAFPRPGPEDLTRHVFAG